MRRAVVLLVVLPLAACGGSKKNASQPALNPSAAVREAATKTAAQGSEHLALKGAAAVGGSQVIVTGAGDFKGHDGTLHLDVNAGGLGTTIDAVLAGTKLYLRSPLLTTSLPQGKTWLAVDIANEGRTARGLSLPAVVAQDPAQTLARLGALSGVSKVGDEQVGGVDTTHYRGRLAATATRPGGTYDVWVGNSDGYVHRVRISSRISASATLAATTDLSDFGKSVTVKVPAASETHNGTTSSLTLGG
jgi:hypothetical protein